MPIKNDTLKSGIEVVTALLGIGGSFLLNLLPNNGELGNTNFLYGTAHLTCLIIFLILKYLIFKKSNIWFTVAVISAVLFVVFSFLYYSHSNNHYKKRGTSNVFVITAQLSDSAMNICNQNPNAVRGYLDCEDFILSNYPADAYKWMWDKSSYETNKNLFIIYYFLIIFFISITIFSLIELINFKGGS